MENIYQLSGKFEELNARQEELQNYLDALYEEQGGEVTEETEEIENTKAELDHLKEEVIAEIIANSDSYAEIALNKAAQRKAAEATLKEIKEACKARIAKAEAYAKRFERSEAFWKENFIAAMNIAGTTKIGGAKTDLKYGISIRTTDSIEADEERLKAPYQLEIDTVNGMLPDYLKVEIKVAKKAFDGIADSELPEGATRLYKQSVTIR